MAEFLRAALSMPTLVFSIGLAVVCVYWLVVIFSGMNSDLFGGEEAFGVDGVEAGLDGAARGGRLGDARQQLVRPRPI